MRAVLARFLVVIVVAVTFASPSDKASAEDLTSVFRGKTINFVIGGSGVGGGYDTYGRLIATHIGRHLPGNPNVVPQNLPGAGGVRAANFLYSLAPKDGLTLGIIDQAIYLDQILGKPELKSDATKFNWIGRMLSNVTVLFSGQGTPIRTIEDAATTEFIVAAPGSASRVNWTVLKNALGLKIKIITGYGGTNEGVLAMQRGEVHGLSMPWPLVKGHADWLENKTINLLLQTSLEKSPELQHVPRMLDLAKDDDTRRMLELFSSPSTIGRSVVAPPGLPVERVAALRAAFMAAISDPEFIAAASVAKLDLDPMSGQELQRMIEAISFPPALVEKARKMAEIEP